MSRCTRIQRKNAVYLVSNTCLQGRCLLKPSPEVNQVALGTLAHSAHRHQVRIYGYIFLANCFFLVVQAEHLNLGKFMRDFQSPLAMNVNRLRKRRGKFFAGRYAMERILDGRAFFERLGWLLNKPCEEHWVEHADAWTGVSSRGWHSGRPGGVSREVTYLNRKKLRALRRSNKDAEEWQALQTYELTVQAPPGFVGMDAFKVDDVPQMIGQMADAAAEKYRQLRARGAEEDGENAENGEGAEPRAPIALRALETVHWSTRLEDVPAHRARPCHTCRDERRKDFEAERVDVLGRYAKAMARHLKGHPRPCFPHGTFRPGFPSCVGAPEPPEPPMRSRLDRARR